MIVALLFITLTEVFLFVYWIYEIRKTTKEHEEAYKKMRQSLLNMIQTIDEISLHKEIDTGPSVGEEKW